MGVIKKKAANPGRVEPGVRYHCDVCNGDITFTVSLTGSISVNSNALRNLGCVMLLLRVFTHVFGARVGSDPLCAFGLHRLRPVCSMLYFGFLNGNSCSGFASVSGDRTALVSDFYA